MKKLWLALCLVVLGFAPAQAQTVGPTNSILCNKMAYVAVGSTGNQQIVAAVTGQRIFICGWHVTNTGTSGTWAMNTGTGSNCGSSTTALTPAQNVTSSAPSADHIDFASIQTPQSVALCVNPSVNTIAAQVFYSQF
jgi:hypothetical protein